MTEDRSSRKGIPDPATEHEAHAIELSLRIALEGVRLARKSLRMTRISDDQVAAQKALDDAQKVLERAIPTKTV